MPRRSRYTGGKNTPPGRGRKPGTRVKPPENRPSVPVVSEQANILQPAKPARIPSTPFKKDAPVPAYIMRELKTAAVIAGLLVIILIVLSLVL